MQKLLTRAKYTKDYAARRLAARQKREEQLKITLERQNNKGTRQEIRRQNQVNRQARWNSVYRGHLAPRLDVGADAERYGTVPSALVEPKRVHPKFRTTCPFVKGDRVVLVGSQYRDRGRIGTVERVDEDGQCVLVEGVETAVIYQPKFMRLMTKTEQVTRTVILPIPFKDVRLVYPLENPLTGILRDVIINEITLRKPNASEKRIGLERPIRYIAGVEPPVELPYPEEKEPEYNDTDSDTLRIEVEERTWVPTLGIPPMPENVIDELRHKYSRYRTRFDDATIAKKEAAHQRVVDKQKALKMAAYTPLDEIQHVRRDELRRFVAEASEGGAWKPLSMEVIEGMARLGLENQKAGRVLPARTREQFERIREGFVDDEVVDEIGLEAESAEDDLIGEAERDGVVQDRVNP